MGKFVIVDHPLVQNKIAMLRKTETGSKEFRELASEVAMLVCYEATRDIPLHQVEIETPVTTTKANMITDKKFSIAPVIRAGIGMVDGILRLMPTAKVAHIGLYRDPETLLPVEYFSKFPSDICEREVFVIDPMLATGGTAVAAIQLLKDKGVKHIKFLCLLSCPEGVKYLTEQHPDVDIYTAAHDEKLNDHGYIVPGLGDAGDRLFGTK
ncbi:MAG: uracil phosphoribosyltransferase [Defluviitaleaceae bacterium]|nr:uracil phosphoribosyltransferase [Defluviitaleaceae bacterium]